MLVTDIVETTLNVTDVVSLLFKWTNFKSMSQKTGEKSPENSLFAKSNNFQTQVKVYLCCKYVRGNSS